MQRTCSAAEISHLVVTKIPQDQLPIAYLNSLSADDKTVCLWAIMICWVMSKMTMVPREMQLRVVLADVHVKDALVVAGTGSGKTLLIALCILLDDPTANYLSITIYPLKRLQVTQESDFNNRFVIPTVTITISNKDTPRDNERWNVSTRNISPVYTLKFLSRRMFIMHLHIKWDVPDTWLSPSNNFLNPPLVISLMPLAQPLLRHVMWPYPNLPNKIYI